MSKQKDLREISYEIANAERRIRVEQAYILKMREIRKEIINKNKNEYRQN